ncbi:Short C-terminal domain [Dehalogenimonas alkenigignens]|uniref:Short C-terminal domain n=1 Tax=Dehalogenimonas alkenigignens TaxID=1217799 RepID=A0A0W0GL58_9CHLR|nr:SHOCT domain-containing protein [Dehalogenimonas alkenigignens]KTB49295.1 Short C-terminal domain [Dehalogenimonas alkenigignens]
MWYGDNLGIGMWLMMSFMVVFWVGIAALVVWLITRATKCNSFVGEQRTPLEIVRERYAKGEISKEEFEELRKNLV